MHTASTNSTDGKNNKNNNNITEYLNENGHKNSTNNEGDGNHVPFATSSMTTNNTNTKLLNKTPTKLTRNGDGESNGDNDPPTDAIDDNNINDSLVEP